jgi:membrane fusion protein, multidrug efflux system
MKRALMTIVPLLVLIGAIVAAGVMIKSRKPVETKAVVPLPPLVKVQAVTRRDHQFIVKAQGTVAPRAEITLASEVSGRILKVSPAFANGGFFEAGEALATIDARDYELAVTQAQARLAEAKTRLTREQAESAVARKEWLALGKKIEEANPLVLRAPQIAEIEAAVSSAQASLEQAGRDLERCVIKAPFAGRIWEKKVDAGQYVAKGTMLARLYAVDYAEIKLPLPTDDLAFLDVPYAFRGEKETGPQPTVKLSADFAGQKQEWTGKLIRTEGEMDIRTRMLPTVVRVENPYGRGDKESRPPLSIGMFVQGEIMGKLVKDVFVIPRLAYRGNNEVMVVDKDSKLRFRTIEIIRLEASNVIAKSGLEAGDRVCVSPLDAPVDGMSVRFGKEAP